MSPQASAEERFARLAEALLSDARVSEGRMFGSAGLKVGGKVFAMLVKRRLVVKLPEETVKALVDGRVGELLDPGHGRLMKEWAAIEPGSDVDGLTLATEAKTCVNGGRPTTSLAPARLVNPAGRLSAP